MEIAYIILLWRHIHHGEDINLWSDLPLLMLSKTNT